MSDLPGLSEIAELLEGRLVGEDPGEPVTGVSTLQDAGPGEICYYGNPKYARFLNTTSALAVIVASECSTSAKCQIIVEDPYDAFRKTLEMFTPDRSSGFAGIHPSAVIHPSAMVSKGAVIGPCTVVERKCTIGRGAVIGPCCVIGSGSRISGGAVIHSGVVILADSTIGERTVIHSGTVIGSDGFGFVPGRNGEHRKIPQNGNVAIGSDVEIGSNCSIDRAVTGSTVIGDFTKLDNLIQVAHNVRIGRSCFIAAQTGIAGSTIIGNGVVLGGQVGVAGHIEIGDGAVVAGKSGVTKSVPAGLTVSGNPCRPHGENLKISAAAARLPGIIEELKGSRPGGEEETEDE